MDKGLFFVVNLFQEPIFYFCSVLAIFVGYKISMVAFKLNQITLLKWI